MEKHYLKNPQFALFTMLYLVIFIGIFLAVYQFILNRSLWLDEASLALNIINRNFTGLTKPLSYRQIAPIGFLFIERISVLVLGKNEFALRIFPLISFLISIPFFYLLADKLAKNKVIALISTSIFSITLSLLRYSSEVKQYSSDVLFAIIILYCSLTLKLNTNRSLFIYAIIGSIAIWFSSIAVIILFVVGIYSLYFEGYQKKNYRVLFPILFWAISFFIYYVFFIHNHPHAEFMIHYWRKAFLPLNPFSEGFYLFLYRAARGVYTYLLGFHSFWSIPFLISLIAVGVMLKNREYTILYFCLAPITVHLFLSGLTLYPFKGRFALYILPLVILVFSIGLYQLFEFTNKKVLKLPHFLLIVPVLVMFYPIYLNFPIQKEEIKNSLSYIEKNIKKDEIIYVYCGSRKAFKFYKETKIININNAIIIGTSHHKENHKYDHMMELLLSNGSELLDVKKYKGSSVYYVDTKKLPIMTKTAYPDRSPNRLSALQCRSKRPFV
jgi:hypothetical protein